MKSATIRLIELAEGLTPSGEIGDGMVARFHALAIAARLEVIAADVGSLREKIELIARPVR